MQLSTRILEGVRSVCLVLIDQKQCVGAHQAQQRSTLATSSLHSVRGTTSSVGGVERVETDLDEARETYCCRESLKEFDEYDKLLNKEINLVL
jgi:hypothetical protein